MKAPFHTLPSGSYFKAAPTSDRVYVVTGPNAATSTHFRDGSKWRIDTSAQTFTIPSNRIVSKTTKPVIKD